jgi:aspartyl-tRNA synthetase
MGYCAHPAGKDIFFFEHLIDALAFGAPPHGGIALGFDRLVMVMTSAENLRDVIAFPKSFAGKDLMGDAPSELPLEYLAEYHIAPISPAATAPDEY